MESLRDCISKSNYFFYFVTSTIIYLKIQLGKKAVLANNKSEFEYATKTKDEYDVEYDKGKTKKIKKKKEKQRIDFNKLFSQKNKQINKNGYSK